MFANKHQRKLIEYIEDAQEWAQAKVHADAEKLSEWDMLLKAAAVGCAHAPGKCSYAAAAEEIFARNAPALCKHKLAKSLRDILRNGPSKTCRVPFLTGPSNTCKGTLLYPFDDLFGPRQVFHKPALGSTFALRNITKGKRFIFWDDFRPVEYAQKTVQVPEFLSIFIGKSTEVQVSQSFNDGNLDVQWSKGAVFTAKSEGLWVPAGGVSAEDVRHIRNRVEEFPFSSVVTDLKDVQSCAPCMANWIIKFAEDTPAAASVAPTPPGPMAAPASAVHGVDALVASAKVSGPIVDELLADIVGAGAINIKELSLSDWKALPSWSKLRLFEARRLEIIIGRR